MNKATEIAIEARAKSIVEIVNACFSDTSAVKRVKAELIAFATDIETRLLDDLERPTPPTTATIPAND
jgi:hypothetical protein